MSVEKPEQQSEATLAPRSPRRRWIPLRALGDERPDLFGWFAAVILALLLFVAAFSSSLMPHDPHAQDLANRLVSPAWTSEGSLTHVLGTDSLGRDVFSRLLAGARLTLGIALSAALLEAVIGITLGLIAGYVGGRTDSFIMRWTDVQMGLPSILLLMTIILMFGTSITTLVVAIAVNGWMIFARVVRAKVLSLKTQGFVEAAMSSGQRDINVIRQHIAPHIRNDVIALGVLEVARIILAESVISFVGIGVQPPDISWGLLLGGARDYIPVASYLATTPGTAILVTVLSLHTVSKWLEPTFDKFRGRNLARG